MYRVNASHFSPAPNMVIADLNFFLSSLPGLVDLTNFFIEILDKHENNYKVDYQRLKDLVEIPFCESINEMENTINYIIFVFFNSDFW